MPLAKAHTHFRVIKRHHEFARAIIHSYLRLLSTSHVLLPQNFENVPTPTLLYAVPIGTNSLHLAEWSHVYPFLLYAQVFMAADSPSVDTSTTPAIIYAGIFHMSLLI